MNKALIGLLIVVLAGITWAGITFPKQIQFGASATGSTFGTAKIAEVVMAPQSRTATSTSILNSDSSDRVVLDAGVNCSGLSNMFGSTSGGLSTYQWYAGTTSSAAPTASIASNALLAMNVAVATTTSAGFTATSTYTNPYARIWGAGTYMTFQTNGTSSATVCQPFVHYIGT